MNFCGKTTPYKIVAKTKIVLFLLHFLITDISTSLFSGAVLESLGDESTMEVRKEKFRLADTDNDGWITYDEFLSVSAFKGIGTLLKYKGGY